MNFLNNLNKTQKYLVVAIMAVIVYLVSATASYSVFSATMVKKSSSDAKAYIPGPGSNLAEDPNEPKTESCPLNGSMHTKKAKDIWVQRRPLAVIIENHQEARPQSGLSSADVVYEAVAEGGITRFMALFYCNSLPDIQVGPVRSARTYFLDWVSEYDALYAHVGGANTPGPANALGQIIDYSIKDLNQFSIGFPTFWRDYQRLGRSVATEHTMYSTTQKLWDVGAKRGWTAVDETGKRWDASFVPWKFVDPTPQSSAGQVATINVPFWSNQSEYTVDWTYDPSCNCYKRKNGGAPHMDLDNNQQLAPSNVVVQFMTESHANDGYEGNVHLLYATNGTKGVASGQALIFQNGKVISGKWMKANRLAREKFVDDKGNEINFVKGQIWIQTVPAGVKVTY